MSPAECGGRNFDGSDIPHAVAERLAHQTPDRRTTVIGGEQLPGHKDLAAALNNATAELVVLVPLQPLVEEPDTVEYRSSVGPERNRINVTVLEGRSEF